MSVVFSIDSKDFWVKQKNNRSDQGGFSLKGDSGDAIILIHGLTGSPNEMKFLANFFNRKGYSVICPRLAGHGASVRVLKNLKWQDFYESVRDAMRAPEISGGVNNIFVSGLSMGALLALLLADEFKERISAASCLAPTLFYDGWNAPSYKFFLPLVYRTPLRYAFYFKEEPPYGIKNEAIQKRVHRYYSEAELDDMENVAQHGYPYFPVALLHQLQLLVKHLTRKLSRIDMPVQLIQAKDDDMASVRNSKFIYDRISSEKKEMILLYDSYHVITADQERDVVAQRMEDFFLRVKENPRKQTY